MTDINAGVDTEEATPRLLEPFRDRSFSLFFGGQLISQIGDGIYIVALPFIVLGADHGAQGLGIVMTCYGIARLVGFPIGGTLTDRFSATAVMIGTDALRTALTVVFAYLAASGRHPGLAAIVAVVVPFGLFDGAFMPASFAVLPQIVPTRLLGPANSLVSTMQSIAMIAGPSAGGLVMATAGRSGGLSLLIDAVTFLVSLLALLGVTVVWECDAAAQPPEAGPGWSSVFRFVKGSILLRMSLLVTVVVNLAYAGLTEVALPSFAVSPLDSGARGFGLIMASYGAGSLIGAFGGMRLLRHRRRGPAALVLGVAQGAAVMCAPLGNSLAVTMIAMLVAATVQAALNVFFISMLQGNTPANLLGRVMSLLVTCAGIAFPVSTALAGGAVRAWGPALVIVLGGLGISIAFAIGFTSRTYRGL